MYSMKQIALSLAALVVVCGCAAQQPRVNQGPQERTKTTTPTDEELRAENARLRTELAKAEEERKAKRAEEERRAEEMRKSEATGQTPTSSPSPAAPPHRINDTDIKNVLPGGPSIYLFLVVKPDLSENDAWAIINVYDRQYSNASVLNIDMLCSSAYATRKYAFDPLVKDREYYRHVLYSFMGGSGERHFNSPSNPSFAGQGSECKRDAGL